MYAKPLPVPDPDSAPFWDGCREGRLLLQRCSSCQAWRFPPERFCPHCQSDESAWLEASGRGTVYSWIVVHHPVPRDLYDSEVPYVVALIDLEEGPRIASNVVGCEPDAVEAGMAVTVGFDAVTEDVTLPRFRPAG